MIRTELSLLDAIAIEMRCEYLSDLRYLDSSQRALLAEKLKQVSIKPDSLRDWNGRDRQRAADPSLIPAPVVGPRLWDTLSQRSKNNERTERNS